MPRPHGGPVVCVAVVVVYYCTEQVFTCDPSTASSEHAAFLPAAETAVSLVHDAHPRLGETVAVFGQGVIGLLVTAALAAMGLRVHAVDLDPARRDLARRLGAAVATGPENAPRRAADVAIECSGSPKALQAAIDAAVDHGTIVIASWYGRKPVALTLGMHARAPRHSLPTPP